MLECLDCPDNGGVNFNNLMQGVVDAGIIQIKDAVAERICELEAAANEQKLDVNEEKGPKSLQSFDPDNDIQSYHNYLDTNVWIERYGEIYQ